MKRGVIECVVIIILALAIIAFLVRPFDKEDAIEGYSSIPRLGYLMEPGKGYNVNYLTMIGGENYNANQGMTHWYAPQLEPEYYYREVRLYKPI